MGLVTITGTLATDETTARSATTSFVLDVVNFTDTTQPVGTSYELLSGVTDSGSQYMWTVVENTGAQEAVVRVNTDGTNYIFLPLPGYAVLLIPAALTPNLVTAPVAVSDIRARALTGTSILRVIALFVA